MRAGAGWAIATLGAALGTVPRRAHAQPAAPPEYRLKAAFLYNFALFTEWPTATPASLQLCILGADPFGAEADGLQGKAVGSRTLAVQRRAALDAVAGCHVVFVPAASIGLLPRVTAALSGQGALIISDSPGALRQGAMLNMNVLDQRVTFEANLVATRAAGLGLSSRLLRLATEVVQ
jgi:YfiR/HmsC-like